MTLGTKPKPVEELQGLVYGMANTDESVATSHTPLILGGFVLVGAAGPDDRVLVGGESHV